MPQNFFEPQFAPVAEAFMRLVARGPGGGALVVRRHGETVLDLVGGTSDRYGTRRWDRDTMGISFSTTKGVATTVIHRLAERGLLAYDEPVASFWPEFAAGGKGRLTVRELLTHRAGLASVRAVAQRAEEILDHHTMEERLAARAVAASPTPRSAYHALTYGWLLSGLARRVTGKGMAQLVQEEVVGPLGISGMHLGVPPEQEVNVAAPVGSALRQLAALSRLTTPVWSRAAYSRTAIEALLVPGFHRLFEGPRPPIWRAEMPAVNGVFTADALSRMYAALANGGGSLLKPETTREIGRVQLRSVDTVLGLRMRWRLGYHQGFGTGPRAPWAFGHYGYGGSGGWADPQSGISLGFVTNRIGSVTTPLGDLTLYRLTGLVRRCAEL
jgi:CubicO group peptidase (beta-lactamase class C family)